MTDAEEAGWFAGLGATGDADETEWLKRAREAIDSGTASEPANWPERAVGADVVPDAETYYERLHQATVATAGELVREREQADDQQLIHSIRALDDCRRTHNELTERLAEWAGTRDRTAAVEASYVRELADSEPTDPTERRLVSLAERIVELDREADRLEEYVDRTAGTVAPNLTALAGPVLAARLIALAGGLGELAKLPSSTVQLLGAEDALFAHLQGAAPSPKHGVIYTHEYVRGTRGEDRGSAARAVAGKLTIAARVDRYRGEYEPEIEAELDERIGRIRARGDR
ncbi:nucleolar [Halobacteriales archaeon QH_10_67_13]|nr:MAG: nucleolar [Halobacteriales archaeon QH_10_67_13]